MEQAQPNPWEMTPEQIAPHAAPVTGPMLAPTPTGLGGQPRLRPLHTEMTADEVAAERARRISAEADARQAQQRADAGPAGNAAEASRLAAGFFQRALFANQRYGAGVAPRGALAQYAADYGPQYIVNENTGQDRQLADTFAREFVAATLRRESGAAISPAEYQAQAVRYFPQPGDTPETIAAKGQLRETAIDALRLQSGELAGPAADIVRHRLGQAQQSAPPGGYTADYVRGAIMLSHDNPLGGTPPAPDGAANPPSEPPNGGTAIVFGGETPPPAPRAGPAIPPGAQAFQQALQTEIRTGRFHSVDEALQFANTINPEMAQRIDRGSLAAAIRDPSRAMVEVPHDAPPPTPDISALRGTPNAQARAIAENQISSGVPIVGALVAGDQAIRGPEAANALLHGGQDWATFGTRDEINAGIDSLTGQGGNYDANLAMQRSMDAYDSQHHFGDRLTGQIAAGLPEAFLPGGMYAQMARGGAQGFAYGFGSGEGGLDNRLQSGAVNALIGVAAPPAFRVAGMGARAAGRGINALRSTPALTAGAQDVADAAQQEGVRISRPILDPASRDRMMYLDTRPETGNLIRQPLANTAADIQAGVRSLGAGGTAAEEGVMGQRVQTAALRSDKSETTRIGRIYDRADTTAQQEGAPPILGREVVNNLDQQIARLQRNPGTNRSLISYLASVRGDFVDAQGNLIPKSIGDIRDIRTNLSAEINRRNLSHTPAERLVGEALSLSKQDVARDFGTAAPEALRLYNQADRLYAAHMATRRQIVQLVTGPADNPIRGDQVMSRIRGLARGSTTNLRRLWGTLNTAEQRDLAATVADNAVSRGENEPFSPHNFITWAENIPPTARQIMFGPEGARSIANLSILSSALKATQGRLNNTRSGAAVGWQAAASRWREAIGSILGAGGTLAAGGSGPGAVAAATGGVALGMATRAVGNATRRMSARSLMNPDVSGWLARAARANSPAAMQAALGRLAGIAARNPAIAQEVTSIRQFLLTAANDNASRMSRAAAESGPSGGDPSQNQQ